MNRQLVSSSFLRSVGYESKTLEIEFRDGGIYQYLNVPEGVYAALMSARSTGSYFREYIKDRYMHRKVG